MGFQFVMIWKSCKCEPQQELTGNLTRHWRGNMMQFASSLFVFFMTKEKKASNQMPSCEQTENDEPVIKVTALVNRYLERAN